MSRADRRRRANETARDARSAAARNSALAVLERRDNMRRRIKLAPTGTLRNRAYAWTCEWLRSLWEHDIWPWRVAFRIGARIVGVDPDEKVSFGSGKPRP